MKTFKQILKEASMWDWIYKKNKGVFYSGVGSSGKGTGLGALGREFILLGIVEWHKHIQNDKALEVR